ncbi:BspA family leucine-rich repeat surface protein, partial [uncultured Brachyspira sp.]
MEKEFKPKTKKELQKLVRDENINLGSIDTSLITDMSFLFKDSKRKDFSGIETWDTSNVVNMERIFYDALFFNHNINNWNVSKVENMRSMFREAESFNQPLDSWDVSNVKDMGFMFYEAKSFNQPLNKWNVSNVKYMSYMFNGAKSFNQPLDKWNTSNVESMSCMFENAKSFNQDLNNWDISQLTEIEDMFKNALALDGNNVLEIYLKFYYNKNTKKAFSELDNLLIKSSDIKKFYQAALKYNKKSVAEIIKKMENNYYDELKDLIDKKEEIIKEYKEL